MSAPHCDLCGAEVAEQWRLTVLYEHLQVPGVKDVCDVCRAETDRFLLHEGAVAQRDVDERFRQWLRSRKAARPEPAPPAAPASIPVPLIVAALIVGALVVLAGLVLGVP